MSSYPAVLTYLYGLQPRGMKFGLGGIHRMLRALGNPERTFPSVHIAGSNGKGSTAAMIASILTAAGYRTGLYTSPHILDFRERIRIDGRPISRKDASRLTRRLRPIIERERGTFFEAATAMAFAYFSERRVDIAVVETGLGGRLDATNVIRPLASVITSISLEHTQILGTTLRQIAREKAGIIKSGVPCVSGVRSGVASREVRTVASAKRAQVFSADRWRVRRRSGGIGGSMVDVLGPNFELKSLEVPLGGDFQQMNLAVALQTMLVLRDRHGFVFTENEMRRGLMKIRELSGLRGRLEIVRRHPLVLLDVAHNPDAVEHLVKSLKAGGGRNLTTVFGVMKDKDAGRMLRSLRRIATECILVAPRTARALPVADLGLVARRIGLKYVAANDVRSGVEFAFRRAGRKGRILVTGSHFIVGEVLAILEGKKYLTINQ